MPNMFLLSNLCFVRGKQLITSEVQLYKSYSIKNIVVGYLVSKLDVPQKILIVLMEI